ncbi:TorF family putative porin [Pararhizobium sp. YC-54]|uniref:TorF family putative porin n=1 Tax=Pararhizobium sp. YC-54 TaxID=2986920 RepID=UPI0021F6ACB5|nr:TorF family putative porin [Pararhizobium sp. YC-54]MCV9999257.1 TorF family putative porin [Pararhizobium sp. YC-54]
MKKVKLRYAGLLSIVFCWPQAEVSFAADQTADEAAQISEVATPAISLGYGVKFTSDYVFRSQSQSDGKPAVQGYVEGRFLDWFYAGIFMSSVSFPSDPWGLADPAVELDYSFGLRHTWGSFTLDVGALRFTYPGQIGVGELGGGLPVSNMNMWEFAVRPSFVVNEAVSLNGYLGYSPDFVGTGAPETFLSGGMRINLPQIPALDEVTLFTSGELGYQWIGKTDLKSAFIPDADLPDFAVWNIGVGATYKNATLDFRYFGSQLKNGAGKSCFAATSMTKSCGDRFALSLSFDF